MFKKILLLTLIFFFVGNIFIHSQASAQMMTNYGDSSITANPTQIQQQQKDETQGKQFYEELQNKQTTCEKLTDNDFEKIGEYAMSQMFGNNTSAHITMNQRIQKIQGDTGEEQLHIQIGRRVTGCSALTSLGNTNKGGEFHMMGWNGYGMMDGNYGFGGFSGLWIVALLVHIVIIIDLILLGMWLWKQIKKK